MAKFMRALAKMGLVELEEEDLPAAAAPSGADDIDALLAETRAMLGKVDVEAPSAEPPPASAPPPGPPPPPRVELPPLTVEGLTDDRSLPAIYAEAGISDIPFPVERLLKVLDGLSAMDSATRRTVVAAMDEADDTWSIHDVLLDASRKVGALGAARARLDRALAEAESRTEAELAAQDAFAEQATGAIRAQIAELEAALAEEIKGVGEQKSQIRVRLEAARAAHATQAARLDGEIERLRTLYPVFGDPEREQ